MANLRTAALATLLLVFAFVPAAAAGTYTLANPVAGGFWDEPSTWLEDGVPATTPPQGGDTVQLTGSGATVTVRTAGSGVLAAINQNCNCTLQIVSGGHLQTSVYDLDAGTFRLAGGSLTVGDDFFNSGTVVLESGHIGSFWATVGDTMSRFTNSGTIVKSTTGSVRFVSDLNSTGTLNVQAGSLTMVGYELVFTSGSVTVATNAQLTAFNGHFEAGSSVSGGGTVILEAVGDPVFDVMGNSRIATTSFSPTFTVIDAYTELAADLTLENLTLAPDAHVYGTSDITITGNGNFNGGDIQGVEASTITITVALDGNLTVDGTQVRANILNLGGMSVDRLYLHGTLDNRNLLLFPDGGFIDDAGPEANLLNSGAINAPADATINVNTFVNSGDLIIGTGQLVAPSLQLVDGGEIRINGGRLSGGPTLEGGILRGAGTLTGATVNDGATLDPGIGSDTGIIHILDTYTQTENGKLEILLGGTTPGSGYDQVVVESASPNKIGGTLNVTLEAGYVPNDGDFYDVFVSESGITGNFDTVNLPSTPGVTFSGSLYTPPGESAPDRYRIVADVAGPAGPDLAVDSGVSPASANTNEHVTFTIIVSNNGSATATGSTLQNVVNGGTVVSSSTSQGTCGGTSTVTCTLGAIAAGQSVTVTIVATRATAGNVTVTSTASAAGDTNDANDSDSSTATFAAGGGGADLLITKTGPAVARQGETLDYELTIVNDGPDAAADVVVFDTTPNGLTFLFNSGACTTPFPCQLGNLPSGSTRFIRAVYAVTGSNLRTTNTATVNGTGKDPRPSNNASSVQTELIPSCSGPELPLILGPARVTAGATYEISAPSRADRWEIDESATADFASVTTRSLTQPFTKYVHDTPGTYYYRMRAFLNCNGGQVTSATHRVIVTEQENAEVVVERNTIEPVTVPVHVEGFDAATPYTATTNVHWLTLVPAAGTLPPEGLDLQATLQPYNLTIGTHIATVTVVTAVGTRQIPVTVHGVTSVFTVTPEAPSDGTLVIPVVGHLRGINSHWQSDVRISNPTSEPTGYAVTFISGAMAMQTIIPLSPGHTVAFDDIAANWFGVGAAGNDGSGMLRIRPLDTVAPVVTSRTYNVADEGGTLGQGVSAVDVSDFIGSDGGVLTLQQITQSAAFRTNVGIVEGFGAPATVRLSLFDGNGTLARELFVDVVPFQQLQFNALLAGTAIDNGRIEVRVVNGDGRVTAYASVIDNQTQDPLLVSGIDAAKVRSNRYVFAGAADIINSSARWRTDLRLFNAGLAAQTATLTFRPFTGPAVFRELTIQPGHVQALDSVLRQTFGIGDTGGAIHVTTPAESNLVISGRTYNQTDAGTYGQYIPAFLPTDEAKTGGPALQLLHVEDSPRYRSNLGIAETLGGNAIVEISVIRGDSTVVDTIHMALAAYEFRQFRIIRDLNLGDLYNARITVRVIDGNGAVVAYVSLVDNATQDPTYIAAQ